MKTFLNEIVNEAMSLKADSCDVIMTGGESLSLSSTDGKLEKYKIAKTSIIGIRVIKNQRVGLAYSESESKDAISFAIKSAIENSEYSDVNEYEEIKYKSENDFIGKKPTVVDNSTMEEKIEFAIKLETEVKKRDKRVTAAPYNGISFSNSNEFYLNSLGTYTETYNNSVSASTSALLKSGDSTSMHYTGMMAKTLSNLNINQGIDECLEHAINWLEAKPIPSGNYDVIFTADVLSQFLYSFSNYLSAKQAMEKKNPWATKLNQQVASEHFTMIDTPQYKDALTHFHVDSEGIQMKDLTLIENGILKSFYHNSATAKFFNTKNTGHAARGAKSSLGITSTNWLIKPGKNSASDMTEGTYLEIIDTMGIGRGSNLSGDFSFGVSGYLCKNGVRVQPVKEVTIAGNFNNVLANPRMGTTLESNYTQGFFSPKIRFNNLYIAGK